MDWLDMSLLKEKKLSEPDINHLYTSIIYSLRPYI